MAIQESSFATAFGKNKKNNASQNTKEERPKSQFWLNIGYVAEGAGEEGEDRFVSLPAGIPLDTQEHVPTNSRNKDFAEFQAARNDLFDQIMALAGKLEPGEERLLKLQIQLRRVNEEQAVATDESNKFVRKLDL